MGSQQNAEGYIHGRKITLVVHAKFVRDAGDKAKDHALLCESSARHFWVVEQTPPCRPVDSRSSL